MTRTRRLALATAVTVLALVALFGPGLVANQSQIASGTCSQKYPDETRFSVGWRPLPVPGWYCTVGSTGDSLRLGWWLR